MKSVIVLCLILAICVHKSRGTFRDFLSHLPQDIAHAFDVAWTSLTDAIKRPVKMRRIGPAAKRRTSKSSTSLTQTTISNKITQFPITTDVSVVKVTLPILATPTFRSMSEWVNMQKPRFATSKHLSSTADSQRRKLSDEDNFGPLMFI